MYAATMQSSSNASRNNVNNAKTVKKENKASIQT